MKKILILANSDIGLYKFRKELIEELLKENDVFISLPYGDYVNELVEMGCSYIDTQISRRGTNPITDFKLMIKYRKILKRIKPDIVLTYTIKPNIYGGLMCRYTKTPYIANITGLGSAVENGGIMQKFTTMLYKIALKKARCVFFQNKENKNFFDKNNIKYRKFILIPGSGVNIDEYKYEEYPTDDSVIKFLYIGRIMKDKGVSELITAILKIKAVYLNVLFDFIGECDEEYHNKLIELEKKGIIKYHGRQNDVRPFIKESHATILPSYHEGISNVLLESAALGRPVLASNVAGCYETFDEGISGLGFKVKDADSLEDAISKFIKIPYTKKKEMGIEGRKKISNEFNRKIVTNAYINQINKSLNK